MGAHRRRRGARPLGFKARGNSEFGDTLVAGQIIDSDKPATRRQKEYLRDLCKEAGFDYFTPDNMRDAHDQISALVDVLNSRQDGENKNVTA